jgi:hypothetical protein
LKRIAIFAEGQTELIFIREFLFRIFDPSKLSLECFVLLAHKESPVPYKYSSPSAEIHFMIIDAHGDRGVLSSIAEREINLIEKREYDRIIGLRDMYSEDYIKLSPDVITEVISNQIIEKHNLTIENMTYSDKIKIYFAIMEIEAWFLGMYNLFYKINSMLTLEYIKESLNIDLQVIDPQREFYKPSELVHSILELCERAYNKKEDEIESICSQMTTEDFDNARENSRCKCFADFYKEIVNCS